MSRDRGDLAPRLVSESRRTYLANRSDLYLCLAVSPVVGTLGWMLPATNVWFTIIAISVAVGNGIRWGFEEADDMGRWFNPVAAIDGAMTTALYLVVLALVIPAPFLSCLGVPRGE